MVRKQDLKSIEAAFDANRIEEFRHNLEDVKKSLVLVQGLLDWCAIKTMEVVA